MIGNSSNNKRIVKNTAVLYLRMLFLMGISLFTTRVVLKVLGVADYGIYNVVGGVVALFAILSQSLSSACSRFLNYEMGRGNQDKLKKVFSTSMTIQIALAILIAILAEIGGSWFLNNKMVIPEDRLYAANWVLQFSIITFCINLISVPYNAAIIAHERMTAFAYISIYEGVTRLLVCYLVMISAYDKLIVYASLISILQTSSQFIYWLYCTKHFEESKYSFSCDRIMLKELISFTGWNFIGASSMVLRSQGGNILINLFGGPAVNAARGVANQVNSAVSGFSNNFMVAVRPQITKTYAAGDIVYMSTLINQSARFSLYLLLLLSIPIVFNIKYILHLWLTEVPENTASFVTLTLVFTVLEALSSPLITAQMATGKVRNYQLIIGGINLLNIPISYVLMKSGFLPITFLYVAITLSLICLIARLIIVQRNSGFDAVSFVKHVLVNGLSVLLVATLLPSISYFLLQSTMAGFVLNILICFISTGFAIVYVGCTEKERVMLKKYINKHIKSII